jgi:2,3-dihydroxybenzoate-AMP ligase
MLDGCRPWPAELAASYRAAGYWRDRTLGEELRDWAGRHGDRIALVDGDRRLSYADLDAAADRLAAGLHHTGFDPGDRVVVQLPNIAELVIVIFALARLGALPVLALPSHRITEITHLCEISGAAGYLTVAANLTLARQLYS